MKGLLFDKEDLQSFRKVARTSCRSKQTSKRCSASKYPTAPPKMTMAAKSHTVSTRAAGQSLRGTPTHPTNRAMTQI